MTSCRTPGARYRTHISPDAVAVRVNSINDLHGLEMTETDAVKVERALHDAVERILAPFWKRGTAQAKEAGS